MISRRQFTKTLGAALTLTAIKPDAIWSGEPTATATPASASPVAAELYRKVFVLDGNVLGAIGFPISDHDPVGVTKRIVGSGVNVVKSTLGGPQGNFEEAVAAIANAELLMEKQPEAFFKVQRAADFDRAKNEGKLGVIYSFESPNMLEDKIDRIELFRSLGVRVMQLTYNHRTPLGCGCLDGDTDGLTDLGRSAVARMNEVGVALDLSHSNTKTTADGIAASKKPVLITHAGCRAVYMHPRNKEDRELKALADKGGVIGIYMLPFLTEPPKQPMLKDFLQHLDHAVKVCGEDHVGDRDGRSLSARRRRGTCRTETQDRGTESRGDRCARRGSAGLYPGPEYRTETRARDRCVVEARLQKRSGRKNPGRKFQAGPGRHLVGVITQAGGLTD